MSRVSMSQIPDSGKLKQPIGDRDRVQGATQAAIVSVKYGNYQCPHCYKANRLIPQLQQRLENDLCYVFRHFPIPSLHPQSQRAAEAAEVTGEQGKFWEMHHILFEHQHALDDGFLVEYALNLGLNMPRFLWSFSERVYSNRVRADFLSGMEYGVTRKPTFFLNGLRLKDNWHLDTLLYEIENVKRSNS
ncbi:MULTISPECIES: DsbA family protein [Nostocales]|nr:thioredoxin domain-containing protein [Tolypothrix bouteillei]